MSRIIFYYSLIVVLYDFYAKVLGDVCVWWGGPHDVGTDGI